MSSVRNLSNIQSKKIIVISNSSAHIYFMSQELFDMKKWLIGHISKLAVKTSKDQLNSEFHWPLAKLVTKKNRKLKSRLILNVLPFEDNLVGLYE